MARVYATRDQLVDYVPAGTIVPAEPEATRKLTAASKEIERATKSAIYTTDTDGYPTDTAVRQAFADATCAQAEWWIETGDESGAMGQYQSVSIGSVALSRGGRSGSSTGGGEPKLAPKAETELSNAGLLPGSIVQYQTWEGGYL